MESVTATHHEIDTSFFKGTSYPVVIRPGSPGFDIFEWARNNHETINSMLKRSGAILFRSVGLDTVDSFQRLISSLDFKPLDYKVRSSPRHAVAANIYTSTDHPADQEINMHNENSYSHVWPMRIMFFCAQPSASGGNTPIADSRLVYKALSPATLAKFRERGVMYVRNLGGGLGLHWKEVFQTENQEVVEQYLNGNGIAFEWLPNSKLRLRYTRPALWTHPGTGEPVWFNHAFFFNFLSLDKEFREEILMVMDKEDFPFLSYYGDGSEIEPEVIDEISSAFSASKVQFAWEKGDALLLDNMLMSHGRTSYSGERKILVAMSDPVSDADFGQHVEK